MKWNKRKKTSVKTATVSNKHFSPDQYRQTTTTKLLKLEAIPSQDLLILFTGNSRYRIRIKLGTTIQLITNKPFIHQIPECRFKLTVRVSQGNNETMKKFGENMNLTINIKLYHFNFLGWCI